MVGVVAAINWDNLSYASAFLLGAAMATIATIRIVKHVATFFAGMDRRRVGPGRVAETRPGPDPDQEDSPPSP